MTRNQKFARVLRKHNFVVTEADNQILLNADGSDDPVEPGDDVCYAKELSNGVIAYSDDSTDCMLFATATIFAKFWLDLISVGWNDLSWYKEERSPECMDESLTVVCTGRRTFLYVPRSSMPIEEMSFLKYSESN